VTRIGEEEGIGRRLLTVQTGIQYALCVRHRMRRNAGTVFCPPARLPSYTSRWRSLRWAAPYWSGTEKLEQAFTASGGIKRTRPHLSDSEENPLLIKHD
jgi:hypothetical protein